MPPYVIVITWWHYAGAGLLGLCIFAAGVVLGTVLTERD